MSSYQWVGWDSLKDDRSPQIMQVVFIVDNLFVSVIFYEYSTCLQGRSLLWAHP